MMLQNKARPVFLDLYRIKQPITAVVSFGHRVAGVVLAFSVPLLLYVLRLSLGSAQGFSSVVALFEHASVRGFAVLLAWALAHHLCAGVRHLLFDIHVATSLRAARASAWIVVALEAAIVIMAIGVLS